MPRHQGRQKPHSGGSGGSGVTTDWQWGFAPAAAKQIAHLDEKVQQRIMRDLDLLAAGKKVDTLKLEGEDEYRLRVGNFRVIYTVDKVNKKFVVSKVADRKDSYR
jgi:mRNA interferase RelE/StbE